MRRRDLIATGAAWTAISRNRILGANDKIRIAGLGTGGRCTFLLTLAQKAEKTEVVAVCDVAEFRRSSAKQRLGGTPREYLDYREVLGRGDVDAVVIGSPDHWHGPMTIDAVKAGKDVYVEKPVSYSIEDGERIEKAVTASKQIVQVGYQQRSWEHFIAAKELIAKGALGDITLILTSWYQDYVINMQKPPVVDASKVDWKRFLGSAPNQPFDPLRYTRWRWFWDFGGGHLTDLYSHYGDVVQWYMNDIKPVAAQSMGGRHVLPQLECPDTINTVWEYAKFHVVYNGTLNGSLDGGNIVIRGKKATMKINRDGFNVYAEGSVPREKTHYPDPVASMKSAVDGATPHMQNFLDCIRSRKQPNAGIRDAVAIARAAHLGNIAYRKGTRVKG